MQHPRLLVRAVPAEVFELPANLGECLRALETLGFGQQLRVIGHLRRSLRHLDEQMKMDAHQVVADINGLCRQEALAVPPSVKSRELVCPRTLDQPKHRTLSRNESP